MLEIEIAGPGEAVVGLVSDTGRVLITRRWVLSGDASLVLKSRLPLNVRTVAGDVDVVPVVIRQRHPKQRISFAKMDHAKFTSQSCKRLKIQRAVVERAAKMMDKQIGDRRMGLGTRVG